MFKKLFANNIIMSVIPSNLYSSITSLIFSNGFAKFISIFVFVLPLFVFCGDVVVVGPGFDSISPHSNNRL